MSRCALPFRYRTGVGLVLGICQPGTAQAREGEPAARAVANLVKLERPLEIEKLIRDLVSVDLMLWVIGGGEVVAENTAKGMKEPEFGDPYVTVEADSWHFDMNRDSVAGVQFVEAEDHGVPYLYYVRFSDGGNETLVRAYFPNPYLDDDEKPTEFQPEKLKVFEGFRDRYVGQEGITFVQRPRDGSG